MLAAGQVDVNFAESATVGQIGLAWNGTAFRNFSAQVRVSSVMQSADRKFGAPEWLILIAGSFFILVLGLSAAWEADIRWLHFFQAWMYIATMVLSFRGSRWGHFIGISAAGLWDYANIVATSFLSNGLAELSRWAHTGHLARPDLLIAIPAWLSNFLVVLGSCWAYSRRPKKPFSDLAKFLVTFALTTGFFAADMALCQPRYLAIFPRLLHPRLP